MRKKNHPPHAEQAGELGGKNPRGEAPGRPDALADPEQAIAAQQPGGGGAPGTGDANPSPPPSPREGVTEAQVEQSGLDAAGP